MKKENDENNIITESVTEDFLEPKDDKFLKQIPTKDNEILKKLDEIDKKIESFEFIDDEEEKKDEKKKNLGLIITFVTLAVVSIGLFAFEKKAKNAKN